MSGQPGQKPVSRSSTARRYTPRVILTVNPIPKVIRSGRGFNVILRTAPHARVTIVLQAGKTVIIVTGSGKHRRTSTRFVPLFGLTIHGNADGRGGYGQYLRLTYKPRAAVPAVLTITVSTPHSTTQSKRNMTIAPYNLSEKSSERLIQPLRACLGTFRIGC